jgi:putative ABC transport system substrate-binding protein
MRRREFIGLVGGAAATLPLTARAQQPAMPLVGFLRSSTLSASIHLVTAFRQGLKELGFVEGQNVAVEYRYADNQVDRLPALVADLLGRPLAVIVGDTIAAIPVKAATASVPIVFGTGGDPVRQGLVVSLNRPGGNVTGVVFFATQLAAKRLGLLRELVPKTSTIAMLMNPNSPNFAAERSDAQAAAQATGQQLLIFDVSSDRDIEMAFATLINRGAGALLVGSGTFLVSNAERVVDLATRYGLPAIYPQREATLAGGLMSYGTSLTDAYRQIGTYTGRILKGEKPAELPVIQSTKFEFVLNLKTVKVLGLEVPPTVFAIADEVIE